MSTFFEKINDLDILLHCDGYEREYFLQSVQDLHIKVRNLQVKNLKRLGSPLTSFVVWRVLNVI